MITIYPNMKKYTFEIYRDKKKEFRWRLKASNGRIIAESGESYQRKGMMMKTLKKLISSMSSVEKVVDVSGPIKSTSYY